MSARTGPSVPPRPSRSAKPGQETSSSGETPKIPPRPSRRPERASSPRYNNNDAPSPSNTPPMPAGLDRTTSHESNSLDASDPAPSVSLPSVGQEGMEHDSLEQRQGSGADDGERSHQPTETRNVTRDLHLHAPKPTQPSASARGQVRDVTGTTSQQAAAAGVGKVTSPEPSESGNHELNDVAQSSAKEGTGIAASAEYTGTPEEDVGHIASGELATRLASSPTDPVKSPLQQTSSSENIPKSEQRKMDDITHDGAEIQIDEAHHPQHHPAELAPSADEDMPQDGTTGAQVAEEDKDEVPGLAEDEIGHTQSATSPIFERSSSTQGLSPTLTRSASKGDDEEESHKQVDVEGYEWRSPDDDKEIPEELTTQPTELIQPKSSSKDVYEHAPDSLQLEATATTPDIPQEPKRHDDTEVANDDSDPATLVKPQEQPEAETPSYPTESISLEAGPEQEPPETQKLAAVAEGPQPEDKITSPDVSTPGTPPRPPKRPSQPWPEDDQSKGTGPSAEIQKPPITSGPKPQLPARPSRPRKTHPEGEALTKKRSESSEEVETTKPAVKPKPAVPARPAGSKISNLKTGFLSDLNDRLKLGPKPPPAPEKKDEPEAPPAEKGPLSDARKGRARGPARRRPAAPAAEQNSKQAMIDVPQIKLVDPWDVWRISEDGTVIVQEGMSEPNKVVPGGSAPEPEVDTKTPSASEAAPQNEAPLSSTEEVVREAPREHEARVDSEAVSASKPEESQSSAVDPQQSIVSDAEVAAEAQQSPNGKESVEQQQSPSLEPSVPAEPAAAPTTPGDGPSKDSEPTHNEDIESKTTSP